MSKPKPPIRILHLSDVHFSAGKDWDAEPVLRELAQFIGCDSKAHDLTPDLVAFTGDLAQAGKSDDYDLARVWLENQLWPVLSGLPKDRLLLVPGNHDVDRNNVSRGAKSIQTDLLETRTQEAITQTFQHEGDRNLLLQRHTAYLKFASDWYGKPQILPWWQRSLEINHIKLHLAGLDSAFMACGDQDRGNLLISRYQFNQTVHSPEAEGADWRLVLLHHPWDYLAEWDSPEIRSAVHLHRDLLLRGHLHYPQTERIVPPDPNRACLELAAGCLYESSQTPNAFQWIELYREPRKLRVLYRAWRHGVWGEDLTQPGCKTGIAEYDLTQPDLPEPSAKSGKGKAKAAVKLAKDSAAELAELPRYREAAIRAHETLPIAGFVTKLRAKIQLDELFVPLRAMLDTRLNGGIDFENAKDAEDRLRGEPELPLVEAFRVARERRRHGLVILGDPGSGKTTQLKRLLLSCFQSGPQSLGLEESMIPLFLPLRDLADLNHGVDDFISQTLDSPHLKMGADFGAKLLARGRLLLLFDGLDEVSEPGQRAKVARWIEDLARDCPSCFPVVTCRFAGYSDAVRLGVEFLELHLRPLTPEQSDTFIRNWYKVVGQQGNQPAELAAAEAENLVERLREPGYRSQRMAEMTRNPLLLANLCLVHHDRKGILPKGRHELYKECIEVLLENWRRDKKLPVNISAKTGRELLGPLALWLHGQEGRTRASLKEMIPVLQPAIEKAQWQGDAAAFLKAVRDESGLLTGWGAEHYGFMHLGFQEYLAAWEIRRRVLEDSVALRPSADLKALAGHYPESWWQEVILLLLAQGEPALFEPFMREVFIMCMPQEDDQILAFIREEAAGFSVKPFLNLIKDDKNHLALHDAALKILKRWLNPDEWGELLNTLPIPLSALAAGKTKVVLDVAPEDFLCTHNGGVELLLIPGGSFLMGSPKGQGGDDEKPQHEVTIKPFYLGRYPVTNAEYRRFREASTGSKEPEYWADRRFNQDRQPVVGVDWDEARRFCAWAGGRLPTEAEWEYACRAGTLTEFHWGDDRTKAGDFAWCGEDWQTGSTHPVGEKQPNPWGLYDLTGNVWEWLDDVWHDSYQGAPIDGKAWTQGGDQSRRVIRGGSWGNGPGPLRSANRYGSDPDYRFYDLGFRLAQDC
jgi:formylglycine-generating enzyme required for sulfatase activity/predicted MPP superfamily phosphohydrolase